MNIEYYGQGVAEHKNNAFVWYMKAAEQEDKDAQYNVAYAYYWGIGVGKNLIQARAILIKLQN